MRNYIKNYLAEDGRNLRSMKLFFEDENLPLTEVIEIASKAINPTNNGKMFSHQRRIGKEKAKKGFEKLKQKKAELAKCQTFENILKITDNVMTEIVGLGPLWSYDTALRIGFHLKIYPTDVYIQAGVVKGYVKLFGKRPKSRKIPKNEFPMLAELEAYEIENFLCIWGGNKTIKEI